MLEILAIPLLGICVGFLSGFFGIGGGTIIVPLMLAFGFGIKEAIGISILQMLMSSIFGSYFNYKNSDFIIKELGFLGAGAILGASFSGFIVTNTPEIYLKFGLLTALGIAIFKIFRLNTSTSNEKISNKILFLSGFFVALISISMGIGGALFLTPLLSGFFKMDIKKAVSLGLGFVIFSSSSGFISMSLHGLINYKFGFLLGFGSLIGVYFGTKIHQKVSKNTQKIWLLGLYIITFLLTLKSIIL